MMDGDPLFACDDPELLRRMAKWLERRAASYRDRADQLDAMAAGRAAARAAVALAFSTGSMVAAHVAAGMSVDQAMAAVVAETGMPHETVQIHWRRWLKDRRADHVAARSRLVMQYAGRGWTNDEIGRHLGIHPVSVSRIIGRVVRRRAAG